MSTPRDYNQPPWPQRPGYPQQPGNQWGQPPPQWGQPQPQQPYPPQQPLGQQPTQWAQQPPQYGQPAPPQYGQPAPPPVPPPAPGLPKKSGSKAKPLLIGGAALAALMVVILIVLVVAKGSRDVNKVAVTDVQTEVQQVLQDRITGYSSGDIKDVRCNDGKDPTAKKGASITCNVSVRGKQRHLTVTFLDSNGTYEVGLPELEGGK